MSLAPIIFCLVVSSPFILAAVVTLGAHFVSMVRQLTCGKEPRWD